jgi:Fe2+ or Zn2+ uptake regulation protein
MPCVQANSTPSRYCSGNLGDPASFSLPTVYRELQALRDAGSVAFFTCGQSSLETIFLHFAKLSDPDAALEEQEEKDGEAMVNRCDSCYLLFETHHEQNRALILHEFGV